MSRALRRRYGHAQTDRYFYDVAQNFLHPLAMRQYVPGAAEAGRVVTEADVLDLAVLLKRERARGGPA